MKKTILSLAIISGLAFSGLVHGAVDVYGCMDSKSYTYNPDATIADSSCRYHGNGDPMKVPQVFDGLTGYQLPIVKCDLHGILFDRCFDISGTDYYKSRLHPIGITILPKRGTFGDFAFGNN